VAGNLTGAHTHRKQQKKVKDKRKKKLNWFTSCMRGLKNSKKTFIQMVAWCKKKRPKGPKKNKRGRR